MDAAKCSGETDGTSNDASQIEANEAKLLEIKRLRELKFEELQPLPVEEKKDCLKALISIPNQTKTPDVQKRILHLCGILGVRPPRKVVQMQNRLSQNGNSKKNANNKQKGAIGKSTINIAAPSVDHFDSVPMDIEEDEIPNYDISPCDAPSSAQSHFSTTDDFSRTPHFPIDQRQPCFSGPIHPPVQRAPVPLRSLFRDIGPPPNPPPFQQRLPEKWPYQHGMNGPRQSDMHHPNFEALNHAGPSNFDLQPQNFEALNPAAFSIPGTFPSRQNSRLMKGNGQTKKAALKSVSNSKQSRPSNATNAEPTRIAARKFPLSDPHPIGSANYRLDKLNQGRQLAASLSGNPSTIPDFVELQDMISLCCERSKPTVREPFMHPTSEQFIRLLSLHLGIGYELNEEYTTISEPGCSLQTTSCRVYLNGLPSIATLGYGEHMRPSECTRAAYGSAMAALCYMEVIPFEMVRLIQSSDIEGNDVMESVIYVCGPRIADMISLSRPEPLLCNYEGNLDEMPGGLRSLYSRCIHRIRFNGIRYWNEHKVVPFCFNQDVRDCCEMFRLAHQVPNKGNSSKSTRLIDAMNTSEMDPYFVFENADTQQPDWEQWRNQLSCTEVSALINSSQFNDELLSSIYQFGLQKWNMAMFSSIPKLTADSMYKPNVAYWLHPKELALVDSLKYNKVDPVVFLPCRNLIDQLGLSLLDLRTSHSHAILVRIGQCWQRKLVVRHTVIRESHSGSALWIHVVTAFFNGIPYMFLGSQYSHPSASECCEVVYSAMLAQLAHMMIIPRELLLYIKTVPSDVHRQEIVEVVLESCVSRFADLEMLIRNSIFGTLTTETPDITFESQLFPLAELFYQRMRNTGRQYWNENRVILVPRRFQSSSSEWPTLTNSYLIFETKDDDNMDWTLMQSMAGRVDHFVMSDLSDEDRSLAPWEPHLDKGAALTLGPPTKLEKATIIIVKPIVYIPEEMELDSKSVIEAKQDDKSTPNTIKEPDNAVPVKVPNKISAPKNESMAASADRVIMSANLALMAKAATLSRLIQAEQIRPYSSLTSPEVISISRLLRAVASSAQLPLVATTTKDPPNYRCHLRLGDSSTWALVGEYSSEREEDLHLGSSYSLSLRLIQMGILLPGLSAFVDNYECRLPYVVDSIRPLFDILLPLIQQYTSRKERNMSMLSEDMRSRAVVEWSARKIRLPPHMMACQQEQNAFPAIEVIEMTSDEVEWFSRYHQTDVVLAVIVDERGRDSEEIRKKSVAGLKIGSSRPSLRLSGEKEQQRRVSNSKIDEVNESSADVSLLIPWQRKEQIQNNSPATQPAVEDEDDEYLD